MIVIWGSEVRRVRCGTFTAFCPICRAPMVHVCSEIRRVPHVYYIPLGGGDHISDESMCRGCGVEMGRERNTIKAAIATAERRGTPVTDATPLREDLLAQAIQRHERLLRRSATREERFAALREPFEYLRYSLSIHERTSTRTSVNAVVQLFGLAAAATAFVLWYTHFTSRLAHPPTPVAAMIATAIAVPLVAFAVYVTLTHRKRTIQTGVLPHIARSLRPLRPTIAELEETLRLLREQKHPLAAALSAAAISQACDQREDGIGVPSVPIR